MSHFGHLVKAAKEAQEAAAAAAKEAAAEAEAAAKEAAAAAEAAAACADALFEYTPKVWFLKGNFLGCLDSMSSQVWKKQWL